MTTLKFFESQLGKSEVKKLPAKWKRHIRRMDSLPKPRKQLSRKKLLQLIGA